MISSRIHLALSLAVLAWAAAGARGADADKPRLDAYGDPLPAEALLRLGPARFRFETHVWGALSPDGKTLTVTTRQTLRFIDAASGKERHRVESRMTFDGEPVFSPDGKQLAAPMLSGVNLYDPASGALLVRMQIPGDGGAAPVHVSFSGDGKRLAFTGNLGGGKVAASVWEVDSRKQLQSIPIFVQRDVLGVTLSEDGKRLLTSVRQFAHGGEHEAEMARAVQLWDVAKGTEVTKVLIPGRDVTAAVLSPDGKTVAVVEDGEMLSVWDAESGKKVYRQAVGKDCRLLRYSPDGKRLVTFSFDGALQVWESASGKRVSVTKGPGRPASLAFLTDDKVRVAAFEGVALHVWEAPSGRVLSPAGGHTDSVQALSFAVDGKTLWSAAADGVQVWDTATGKRVRHLPLPAARQRFGGGLEGFVLAPDGSRVLCGCSFDRTKGLAVYETGAGREVYALGAKDVNWGESAAFSADGTVMAAAFISEADYRGALEPIVSTHVVRVVRSATGREIACLKVGITDLVAVAVSSDGKAVLTVTTNPRPSVKGELTL